MNNQFGGFDVDPFGTQFQGNGAPASMVQNSQQRANSASNGPCREDYDPTRVLGGSPFAPYNSTGLSTNTGTNTVSASIHASNNNNLTGTHQTLLPPLMAQVGTSLNGGAAPGNLIVGSTGRHSSNGGANTIIYNDLNFDPLTSMRALHPPPQTAAQQAVVNQHLHQHQHVHHHHHHHLTQPSHRQYRKQHPQQLKQQSGHRTSSSSSGGIAMPSSTASYANNIFAQPQSVSSLDQQQQQITRHLEEQAKKQQKEPPKPEPWMEELKITVSGVAIEPMSGYEVIKKLQERATEVLTGYLPCVHFLVQCQQDLRKGLAAAQQKRLIHHMLRDAMTPRQFYTTFIANLPKRFYQENRRIMSTENLNSAFKELQKLCANAKAAEPQGCEIVKNTFLGGMKDGESWGLRKWLSKQGGALYICNDMECLLNSCQKLDRSKSTTAKLAAKLRPLAKNALTRLKNEVPSSYQERSSAHPYLPFFHRLESALRGMSEFDPEDDDVICIDDDEVEELKAKAPAPEPKKQKSSTSSSSSNASSTKTTKRKASEISKTPKKESDGGAGDKITDDFALDLDSDIEIIDGKPPAKRAKPLSPVGGAAALLESVTADDSDYMKTLLSTFEDDNIAAIADFDVFDEKHSVDNDFPGEKDAYDLATGIDQLARLFESSQEDCVRPDFVVPDEFWDQGKIYAKCLRMFSDMLRDPNTSTYFLEPITEDRLLQEGKPSYSDKIKHPICFRDIVNALLEDFSPADNTLTGNTGTLPDQSLVNWNMYNGKELVQAIDIVFLNCLAYEKIVGGSKSPVRSLTNQLRKKLWAFIAELVEEGRFDDDQRKKNTPTRRSENSGFVLLEKSKQKK